MITLVITGIILGVVITLGFCIYDKINNLEIMIKQLKQLKNENHSEED